MFDGGKAGPQFVRAIAKRSFSDEESDRRCRTHAAGDLEAQLVADGLGPELREVLATLGIQDAHKLSDEALVQCLRTNKAAYAAEFVVRIRQDADLAQRAPEAFRAAIKQLRGLT